MREILFRGKDRITHQWVEGSYVHRTMYYGNAADAHFILTGGEFHSDYYNAFEISPDTLGQYTGLTDNNGTKIFEGDIIKYSDRLDYACYEESIEYPDAYGGETYDPGFKYGAVYYQAEYFPGFDISGHDFDCNGLSELNCSGDYHYEVIGNIHDNPELLRGDNNA